MLLPAVTVFLSLCPRPGLKSFVTSGLRTGFGIAFFVGQGKALKDLWITGPPEDVKLDLTRLQGEPLATSTRYTVALEKAPGEEWSAEFRARQTEAPAHRRYELDLGRCVVRFSCRTVDGTGAVFDFLEQLETLVEEINRIVAVRHAVSAPISSVPAAPRAR